MLMLTLSLSVYIQYISTPGPHSSSHRCPTFCYGFRVERHVSWKRCATGFEIRFLLFGGCQPNQQQHVYKPRGIKETARTLINVTKILYMFIYFAIVLWSDTFINFSILLWLYIGKYYNIIAQQQWSAIMISPILTIKIIRSYRS